MKAVRIVQPGKVDILEKSDITTIKENEVLIRLEAIGLCGSDLNTYRGKNPLVSFPRIPGHEISGKIIAIGNTRGSKFREGQRVTVWPYTYCGECTSCRKQKFHCCRNNQTYGVQRDGAAQEFLSVPEEFLIDAGNLEIELTALIEPLSVGWHAAVRGSVSTGDRVAVFGCGLIGLGVIAACKKLGAEVIAVDIADNKLQKASELGASSCINSLEENLGERIGHITAGDGPDISIEAVGNPITFRQAVEIASFSGRVVYIGYAKDEVSYNSNDFVKKEIEIYGSRNAAMEDFMNVKSLITKNPGLFSTLISHEFPFEQSATAFKFWSEFPSEVTKTLIRFD